MTISVTRGEWSRCTHVPVVIVVVVLLHMFHIILLLLALVVLPDVIVCSRMNLSKVLIAAKNIPSVCTIVFEGLVAIATSGYIKGSLW